MTRTWIDTITETPEDKRLFEQERAILEVTELICQLMEEQGISKAKLARKMGKKIGKVRGPAGRSADHVKQRDAKRISRICFTDAASAAATTPSLPRLTANQPETRANRNPTAHYEMPPRSAERNSSEPERPRGPARTKRLTVARSHVAPRREAECPDPSIPVCRR